MGKVGQGGVGQEGVGQNTTGHDRKSMQGNMTRHRRESIRYNAVHCIAMQCKTMPRGAVLCSIV